MLVSKEGAGWQCLLATRGPYGNSLLASSVSYDKSLLKMVGCMANNGYDMSTMCVFHSGFGLKLGQFGYKVFFHKIGFPKKLFFLLLLRPEVSAPLHKQTCLRGKYIFVIDWIYICFLFPQSGKLDFLG